MIHESRRKDDQPSWKKVAHNVVLVGAVITTIAGWVVVAGRHFVIWETVRRDARNIAALSIRVDKAESKLDRRRVELDTAKEEIKTLRIRVREIERK